MTVSVYLPLVLSLALAVVSHPVARGLAPRTAATALVLAAALAALASTWGLLLLGATLLAETPLVAESHAAQSFGIGDPVPDVVAVGAAALLALGAYRLLGTHRHRRAVNRELRALCEHSAAEELVVIDDHDPQAMAVPGRVRRPGHILVTSGMLAALTTDERGVLLAHERAHLRLHHHVPHAVVEAAAALNPLLRPTRDAVVYLLERWADEAAADEVGNRLLAARALARAALATPRSWPLAFHQLGVTSRVVALQGAPPPARRVVAGGVVILGLTATLAAADATVAFAQLIQSLLPGGF